MGRKPALVIVLSLILLGLALRLYRIDQVSFRGDEAFTVLNWVSHPLLDTLRSDIPLADPQPPLAFALFRGWSLVLGTSEFGMRVLPALLSIVGIPALYVLGCRFGSRGLGVLAALWWAVHPFLIWHAQDTKAYAIWASASAIALWLALRALDRRTRLDWLLYIAAAAVAAYLYYLELFSLLALNLYVLIRYRRDRKSLRSWLLSQLAIGLILAPWYIQPRLLFSSGYHGTTYPFEPIQIITWLIPSLNFGARTLPETWLTLLGPLVLLVLGFGLVFQWRRNRGDAVLLGLAAFLPVLLLSLVSLKMNVFTPRYVLSAVPAIVLLVTALIVELWRTRHNRITRRVVPLAIAGVWLGVSAVSLNNYYFVPKPEYAKAPDWRGLVAYLRERMTPNDVVIQAAADEAFTLYFGDLADFERIPANPRQSADEIIGFLRRAETNYASIWLVARTPDDWPNAGVAPDWLRDHTQPVRQTQIGGLPVQQFMSWQVQPGEIEKTPLAAIGNVAEITGVLTSFEPDKQLLVWVYWHPLSQTEHPLKAFLHLVGPVNPATGTPLWSQDDHFPQLERIRTDTWSLAETYRDVFNLPLADVLPGNYDLYLGLYDPETGQRVASGQMDSFLLTPLTIPAN